MANSNAWLAMAVQGRRQHGGNDGYTDEPESYYEWDDTVPNHGSVSEGDAIVLWNKTELLGASLISGIDISVARKSIHKCPLCGRAGFKARATLSPRYKCYKCKGVFENPVTSDRRVTRYRSHHEAAWVDLRDALSAAELRSLCVKPRSQLSLRPLQWNDFVDSLATSASVDRQALGLLEDVKRSIACGHKVAMVRVRIGQAAFREDLLTQFGNECAFSGPCPPAALEACHLYSYARHGLHHSDGGLLLRSDLHTLFDLGLIAIEPTTRRISVDKSLRSYSGYWNLDGVAPKVNLSPGHLHWIAEHWALHRGSAAGAARPGLGAEAGR